MAFLILPFVVVLFMFGLTAQESQLVQASPGAGSAGRMDVLAQLSAAQVEAFGTACINAATATPGVVSDSITVTLPAGVLPPTGAICMTTANTGGGRNVYGYMPVPPGTAGRVLHDTQGSAIWFQVLTTGKATSLVTGEVSAVPDSIPAQSLLAWVQTTS